MRCAITGSNGYVGSAIAGYFGAQGWEVMHLSRKSQPGQLHAHYDLTSDPAAIRWSGVDALVHCAYDFRLTNRRDITRVNVEGSRRLFQAASNAGVKRGVFISSFSSFEGCRSHYGQAKLLLEKAAFDRRFAVVRPGLVHGSRPGGLMGSLEKTASKGKLLPLIGDGSYPQYLVHDEDLARLVFTLCQPQTPVPDRPISAANPEALPLKELLRRIAARSGRKPSFLPIPWPLIYAGLRAAEVLHLPTPFRSDSLIGIVFQNPRPDFTLPPGLNVSFRRFE